VTYFRRSLGQAPDGPITDPSQLEIVGTVTPTKVECAQLPADSPWRRPGQVCAPTLMDWFLGLFKPSAPTALPAPTPEPVPVLIPVSVPVPEATPDTGMSDATKIFLIGGAGLVAYYALRKKRP
jgi:hypothetical protein